MNLCFNMEALSDASLRRIVGIPDIPIVPIGRPKKTSHSGFSQRIRPNRICFLNPESFCGLPFAQTPDIPFVWNGEFQAELEKYNE